MTTATSSCPSGSTPDAAAAPGSWHARRVALRDVRCWDRAEIALPPGLTVISGPNGAGKTTLVEAIALGCAGVSPRTAREAEIVRRGADALHVELDLVDPTGVDARRGIGFQPGRRRRLTIDGDPVRSLAAWRAHGALSVFVPEELRLLNGPPAGRRRALDRLLEALAPGFIEIAARYREGVSQRNALLRRVRAAEAPPDHLDVWDHQISEAGGALASHRRTIVADLAPRFTAWLDALAGGERGLLRLVSSPAHLQEADDPAAVLAAALAERRPRDVAAAQTLSGPHRDDVWIGTAGDVDLRSTGSQGEQRTAALALILAGRDLLSAAAGRPILILDDVLSELDPGRRRALLGAVAEGGQSIVTSADPDAAELAARHADGAVCVEDGRIEA